MNKCCSNPKKTVVAEKGVEEILDFTIDWTDVLAQTDPVDVIADSSWKIDTYSGITILSDNATSQTAFCWITGGTRIGSTAKLTNTIQTFSGRIHSRTIMIDLVRKRLVDAPEPDVVTFGDTVDLTPDP